MKLLQRPPRARGLPPRRFCAVTRLQGRRRRDDGRRRRVRRREITFAGVPSPRFQTLLDHPRAGDYAPRIKLDAPGSTSGCSATTPARRCSSWRDPIDFIALPHLEGPRGSRPSRAQRRAARWILTGTIPAGLSAVDITATVTRSTTATRTTRDLSRPSNVRGRALDGRRDRGRALIGAPRARTTWWDGHPRPPGRPFWP